MYEVEKGKSGGLQGYGAPYPAGHDGTHSETLHSRMYRSGHRNRHFFEKEITMVNNDTIACEDTYLIPFAHKLPVVIESGSGVDVWDTAGKHYIDFTAGWAVTSLGHSDPVIIEALCEQARKILHNPESGLTYSPPRARLLRQLAAILPKELHHFYLVNSGAEANDSALKLARKITGRKKIVSTQRSFHGRTTATTSVTGQPEKRDRFDVQVPHTTFIPFNDLDAAFAAVDHRTAAVIVEPIQGEGGIYVPDEGYLDGLKRICRAGGALLIVDEVQTGFWRTGPAFSSIAQGVIPDFLTLAKGIAGGFPFAAVAVAAECAAKIEPGDHGGTYNGNPLGCAVAEATIRHCVDIDIGKKVERTGACVREHLETLARLYPSVITEVRGRGLLWAIEFHEPETAQRVRDEALASGLILNVTHGKIVRIFPALTIDDAALEDGCAILYAVVKQVACETAEVFAWAAGI